MASSRRTGRHGRAGRQLRLNVGRLDQLETIDTTLNDADSMTAFTVQEATGSGVMNGMSSNNVLSVDGVVNAANFG